jgi:hypothetical protein
MSESTVFYRFVTDTCRERPKDDVLNEIINGLTTELSACLDGWEGRSGVVFHVRLSVERLEVTG